MSSLDMLMIAAASAVSTPGVNPVGSVQKLSHPNAMAGALAATNQFGPQCPGSMLSALKMNAYFADMQAVARSQQMSLARAAPMPTAFALSPRSQKDQLLSKRKRCEDDSISGPRRSDSCDSIKDMTPPSTVSDREEDAPSTPDSRPIGCSPVDEKRGIGDKNGKHEGVSTPVTPETSSPPMATSLVLTAAAASMAPSGLSGTKRYKKDHDVSSARSIVGAAKPQQIQQPKPAQNTAQQQVQILLEQHALLQKLQEQHKLQQQYQYQQKQQQQSQSQHQQLLKSQLQQRLLHLQYQQSKVQQHMSQASCFTKGKETNGGNVGVTGLPTAAAGTAASASSMPMSSHPFAASALMGLVPDMMLQSCGVQGLQTAQDAAKQSGAANGSPVFNKVGAAQADAAASAPDNKFSHFNANDLTKLVLPNPYVMALNNAVASAMLGQIGGIEARKAETRRREQRRLSAQRRRERKRGTLSELEANVSAAKKMDANLSKQLHQHLAGWTSSGTSPAQAILDKCDAATLTPVFPVWKDILENARKEAKLVQAAEDGEGGDCGSGKASISKTAGALEKDKLTIRRERNRISARMSRLRKRLRQEYLEDTLAILSKRVNIVKSALNAGGVQIMLHD